jgi:hypothetical protein
VPAPPKTPPPFHADERCAALGLKSVTPFSKHQSGVRIMAQGCDLALPELVRERSSARPGGHTPPGLRTDPGRRQGRSCGRTQVRRETRATRRQATAAGGRDGSTARTAVVLGPTSRSPGSTLACKSDIYGPCGSRTRCAPTCRRANRTPPQPPCRGGFRGLGPRSRHDEWPPVRALRGQRPPRHSWACGIRMRNPC